MSQVSVRTSIYSANEFIDVYSIECPFCHSRVTPVFHYFDKRNLFASCPNESCGRYYALTQNKDGKYVKVAPNSTLSSRSFSDIICSISSGFVKIYNQSYQAEQMNLDQICGVGYRKALEFLIKDYLISKASDEHIINSIKSTLLSNCIKKYVQNENIKNVAERATWLGNDETHYVRIWADKDVTNLKHLIDLTVRWIENEVETERVLQDMVAKK